MKVIQVVADWQGMQGPVVMGSLKVEKTRGKEVFSFTYTHEWLTSGSGHELDPDLRLYSGPQYLANGKTNFGLFLDSSPDRWGRMLMDRRESISARLENRDVRPLFESDYLLGVHDESRMGALRFRKEPGSPFLANEPHFKAPPLTSIRELEQASRRIEADDFFEDQQALHWLRLLIAPGSSLGGARPKANVRDLEGKLWIAKFPSKNDEFDSGAWEFVTHELAQALGIRVAPARAERYSQGQHTYLVRRFDRNENQARIHFASAMTLLGYQDGDNHHKGISYLEMVEWLETYGSAPRKDIRELWCRILFSVLVSNTDDHLRNHGFLLSDKGWRLSPAYDINPNPKPAGLSLNISETDNSLHLDLCLEVAPLFRWETTEALTFLEKARSVVAGWERLAKGMGIPASERVLMAPAFRLAN
jgi:serine/threonine-protein kinase HipA